MPAISTSRTWISLTSRCAVPSGKTMSTLAVRGAAVAKAGFTSSLQVALTSRAGAVAVIEAPDAAFVRRHRSGEHDADAVIARRQIDFALAVAIAEFQELARTVDAQPLDRVARPAAAVGLARQALLGREHAVAARCGDVTLEVGLVAEQAKPVLDLPFDMRGAGASGLGVGSRSAGDREGNGDQAKDAEMAHDDRRDNGPMTSTPDAAEM